MRLDKFLKVSRVIKRRSLAKEISDDGRVKVNGHIAKAGTTLSTGDILEIRFGQRTVTLEVLQLEANAKKDEASRMYKVIKEERAEQPQENEEVTDFL